MFAGAWWYYGPALLLASRLVFGCALIVLFAIDLEHQLLPNAITLPGIVVGFVFSFFTEPGWLASLLGILVGGGMLYAIARPITGCGTRKASAWATSRCWRWSARSSAGSSRS